MRASVSLSMASGWTSGSFPNLAGRVNIASGHTSEAGSSSGGFGSFAGRDGDGGGG